MHLRDYGVVGVLALALTACNHQQAASDAAGQSASGQVERVTAIGSLVRDYQLARAAQQWDLALSYADRLRRLLPNGTLPGAVQASLADTGIRADEVHDRKRLAGLWTYNVVAATGDDSEGALTTASIGSDATAEASGDPLAKLVLRDHPKWGHSMAVVLDGSQFDCAQHCQISVQFDDQPAREFAASRTAQSPLAMTIDDEKTLRDNLDKIRVLTIGTRVDGKPISLSFAVGGFVRVQLERKLQ
jgi:hypothetical protein